MICRLCLIDLVSFIEVFNNVNSVAKVADAGAVNVCDIIRKYFKIHITHSDPVSTKICNSCWQQLLDFHQFQLMVEEKQLALQLKSEDVIEIHAPELHLLGAITDYTKNLVPEDIKDAILCEPIIDAIIQQDYEHQDNNNMGTNSDDVDKDNDDDGNDYVDREFNGIDISSPIEIRQTRAKRKSTILASSRTKTLKKTKSKYVKSAATALKRSLRNKTKTKINMEYKASEKKVKTSSRRGRPKGVKTSATKLEKKNTKVSTAELEEKRAFARELDAYIAANVKLECCLCSKPLKDFGDLKRHFRAHHNCVGYVRCCNKRYRKRTLYVDHLHLHNDPEYFRCKICEKNYLNRNSYEMHELRFHSNAQDLKYECDICGERYAKSYLLTMHKKNHKGTERNEICSKCNKGFRTPHELKAHEKRMHDDAFEPVICDICGAHFRNEVNFIIHKKTQHHKGPPQPEVQCHLCGRWLRDERCLRRHILRHEDHTTYKCNQCGVFKKTRASLAGHIRYHHSTKHHKCTLCDKEFKMARSLKEHMATHTGVDLYSCPFCPRTFKSYANMHNHKKKMHSNDWVRKNSVPSVVPPITNSVTNLNATEAILPQNTHNSDGTT